MGRWEVWRQDDNGNRYRIGVVEDRVTGLSQVLGFEARAHKQMYWIAGPPDPVCRNADDLRERLLASGERMNRSLSEFLRAWLRIGELLKTHAALGLDTVAASVMAAESANPLPALPAWHGPIPGPETPAQSYADWAFIVQRQAIAEMTDLTPREYLERAASHAPATERVTWADMARMALDAGQVGK